MQTILLVLHVTTAILFLGPVMVTVSAFGKNALAASKGDKRADGVATNMHGITKVYGYLSILVPLFGVTMLFSNWDVYRSQPQFHISLVLAVVAWLILLALIIPRQAKAVEALSVRGDAQAAAEFEVEAVDFEKTKSQLAMFGGIFNLLWIIMLILMYI